MKDKIIVSVASLGREDYREAQMNMIKSCVSAAWDGDYMLRCVDGYCDQYLGVSITLGSWPITKKYGVSWQSRDMPYQFKPFAIQEALEAGYKKILWMDSTCRMLKNPKLLFDIAAERGVVAWNNAGFPVVEWTSDTALRNMGETVESLQGVRQIMACCILFDFNVPATEHIFHRWIQASGDNTFREDGTDRPGFRGNRHDQSALSIILHQFNIHLLEYGEGFCYYPKNETGEDVVSEIFIINKGIKD
jgi:hypothetical protein